MSRGWTGIPRSPDTARASTKQGGGFRTSPKRERPRTYASSSTLSGGTFPPPWALRPSSSSRPMLRAAASGRTSENAARTRSDSETRPRMTGITWTRPAPTATTSISRLPLLDQLEDLRAVPDLPQLVPPDHGGPSEGHLRDATLHEEDAVPLHDPGKVRDDARLVVRALPGRRGPREEDDLPVLRERLERALHRGQDVVSEPGKPLEYVPVESLDLLEAPEQVRDPRGVLERVHRHNQRLADELLEPERDVDRRGHPLEVHLNRPPGDPRHLREGAQGDLLRIPRAPERLPVELHVQAAGRGEDERRHPLLEEVDERLAGEDRDPGPCVDHAVLQGTRPGALPDAEGRTLEGRRDHPELLRPLLRERVHVQEDLHHQQDLVPPRDDVEREAPGVRLLVQVEPGLREDVPHVVEQPVAIHGRKTRHDVYKMCATAASPWREPRSSRSVTNPLSRPLASCAPMAGELRGEKVVVDDPAEASALHNRGSYGEPLGGGGLSLTLLEAVYLVETGRLDVRRDGGEFPMRTLFRTAAAAYDQFEIKYVVYRDLRQRGYVVIEGADPPDFLVYPRGGTPKKTPAKFWAAAISERAVFDADDLAQILRRIAGLRKNLLLAVVDEESDLTYYAVREAEPAGRPLEAPDGGVIATAHLLEDRAMVVEEAEAQALHGNGFYGKIVGRRLQLSLIETAHLLKRC